MVYCYRRRLEVSSFHFATGSQCFLLCCQSWTPLGSLLLVYWTYHRPRPGPQCSFVPWRWHVTVNRNREFEALFYLVLRAGERGSWKWGWNYKKDPWVVHISKKHSRSFFNLVKTISLLKSQLRYLLTVEIWPSSTRLIPYFGVSLPHRRSTTVS